MSGNKGYLYTNGVIASISNKLISKDNFLKIINAKTIEDTISQIKATSIISEKQFNSISEYDELLNKEMINLHTFLTKECPLKVFVDYINWELDITNLENMLKSRVFNQELNYENLISGNISIKEIKDVVYLNKKISNTDINAFMSEINQKLNKCSWREIDYRFKLFLYEKQFNIVKNDKILKKIMQYRIDFQNILMTIRVKDRKEVENQFIPNGNINIEKIYDIFDKNYSVNSGINDDLIKLWITKAFEKDKNKSYIFFEKARNTIEINALSEYYDDIETIVPFLKYYYKRILEIKNLRMICSLKINGYDAYIKDRFLEAKYE